MHRNRWVIASAAAIGIIFAIFFFNQNLYQPSTIAGVDKFGIRKIYPTKSGGEEWFMNMQNPTHDPRFDPQANITKNPDGSYKIREIAVRMDVFTSAGYHPDKSSTLNQKELAAKGYMQSPNDWICEVNLF